MIHIYIKQPGAGAYNVYLDSGAFFAHIWRSDMREYVIDQVDGPVHHVEGTYEEAFRLVERLSGEEFDFVGSGVLKGNVS